LYRMTADILLVDDNAIQATTRRTILSRIGRSVAVAHGAQQALDMLNDDQRTNRIGMVITDHWMPGMNGPEFIAILRRQLPDVPVLVLSGLPDVESEYEGLDVIFRIKPMAPEQLIALVESLLQDDQPMSRTA
jgi:DNA-binding NtrC family response regulator